MNQIGGHLIRIILSSVARPTCASSPGSMPADAQNHFANLTSLKEGSRKCVFDTPLSEQTVAEYFKPFLSIRQGHREKTAGYSVHSHAPACPQSPDQSHPMDYLDTWDTCMHDHIIDMYSHSR